MSHIHVLSDDLINRIAAGEVIERPASVLKELVENAIDAGAKRIQVLIERAGKRRIAVVDDGLGMDGDDALLAIEPHATSKIGRENDIYDIHTLGFRGEAVPSIAAVSHFTLTTRRREDDQGCRVTVSGGRLERAEPVGCPPGTTVDVRDLFFNTPVRKKFLKSDDTESFHIQEMFLALALPYSQVGFELTMDGRKVFASAPSPTPEQRIKSFFGRDFADHMVAVNYREGGVRIWGYVGEPGLTRTTRREQRTFVNGRAVESFAIYKGLRDGLGTLEKGRHTPCVIFLELPTSEVDVNVHPAKREVRFRSETQISRMVAAAVSAGRAKTPEPADFWRGKVNLSSLIGSGEVDYQIRAEQPKLGLSEFLPETALEDEAAAAPEEEKIAPDCATELQHAPPAASPEAGPLPVPDGAALETDRAANVLASLPVPEIAPEAAAQIPMPEAERPTQLRLIGILCRSYLLCEGKDKLVLIDQHAAHERVMYEKLLASGAQKRPVQYLLLPETIELAPAAAGLAIRNQEQFARLGFEFEPLGNSTLLLSALPVGFAVGDAGKLMTEMLSELVDNARLKLPVRLEFIARAACKAAVKFHDDLTENEAYRLLSELESCLTMHLCPHGRPTMLTITLGELARRFGR
ncbi:MAG: DNA mismatch repair endonuclease MutL [Victivallaceae bacterium]|nr:DNA mismatch repair endonuclease MutL [Victivallaceae bacterium]